MGQTQRLISLPTAAGNIHYNIVQSANNTKYIRLAVFSCAILHFRGDVYTSSC